MTTRAAALAFILITVALDMIALGIIPGVAAPHPRFPGRDRNVGLCYDKYAQAYAHGGNEETHPAAERTKDWVEARAWYKKTWELFSALRDHGGLMPADAQLPDQFANKSAECDMAISRLAAANRSH
ncbi:MAG: hypothetical protein ABI540_06465 [Spartobacteria bacterium]